MSWISHLWTCRSSRSSSFCPRSRGVKPQFEAGREKVGKKGVVRDPAVHLEVLEHFLEHAKESRFTVLGLTYSPIRGPEGNIEYLGYLSRAEEEPPVHDLKALVEASHAVLEEKKGENDA